MFYPIYTETTSCRDCYKCVRQCPVKAVRIKDGNAYIMKDMCIYCGKCVHVCPNSAKKIRDDVDRVRLAIKSGRKAICSIAPSFASEFSGYEDAVITALYKLGFSAVSETAIGAKLVTDALDLYASEHQSKAPFIGTACPSVVELVKKYYPDDVRKLAPVPSPLQSHSAYLRKLYGDDILIVFVGPCVAKKLEADTTPGYPDFALTFKEFRQWLELENISLEDIVVDKEPEFVPAKAGLSTIYPIEGGQILSSEVWKNSTMLNPHAVSLSGMEEVLSALSWSNEDCKAFLELLACDGGCVNGPGADRSVSIAKRKRVATDYTLLRISEKDLFEGDKAFSEELLKKGYGILQNGGPAPEPAHSKKYSEADIRKALVELGKVTKADELNCGGCGYSTCRDFAIAYLSGMAESEMCVTKMRKEAESKVDVLLRNIPNGIVIVDSELRIADCNTRFLDIFGDMEEGFVDQSILSMVRGLPIERFVPFADKFRDQFYLAHPGQYRMHYKDKFIRVTFFLVENKRLLGAMFEDVTNPTVRRETVVKKAEDVIQNSLETVQKIASLLGENAAETEIMLNSLIEAFSATSGSEDDSGFSDDDGRDLA